MGSRARNGAIAHHEAQEESGAWQGAARSPGTAQYINTACSQAGRCSARSLLIYPPAGVQWSARPGGLWGGFPNPAYLNCMAFAKNGLPSSRRPRWPGGGAAAWPSARGPRAVVPRVVGARPGPPTLHLARPTRLPYTAHPISPLPPLPRRPPCTSPPGQPTLYPYPAPGPQAAHPVPPPRPGPQAAYPAPAPAPGLPGCLPYTRLPGLPPKRPTLYRRRQQGSTPILS